MTTPRASSSAASSPAQGSRPGGRPKAGMTSRQLSTETTNTFKARELWIYLPAVALLLLASYL